MPALGFNGYAIFNESVSECRELWYLVLRATRPSFPLPQVLFCGLQSSGRLAYHGSDRFSDPLDVGGRQPGHVDAARTDDVDGELLAQRLDLIFR